MWLHTSAEGAHAVNVLPTDAALTLLLEGLFFEDVRLSLPRLYPHTRQHTESLITKSDTRYPCRFCSLLSENNEQTLI